MLLDPAALAATRDLVRAALDLEEGRDPAVPLVDADWHRVLRAVGRHRVAPVLRSHAESLDLPAGVRETLEEWRVAQHARASLQTFETVRVLGALEAAGVEALLVKGQALAMLTTGDPGARGTGDIDLLVAPAAADAAHEVLVAAGWRTEDDVRAEPGTWSWRHLVRRGSALGYRGPGGDVDLHWRLEAEPSPHPPFETLWGRRTSVVIGGREVATLAAPDALRHLAAHREGWTWLRTLVDLRRLARDPAVWTQPLHPTCHPSMAMARASLGLPVTVPRDVLAALDAVAPAELERMRRLHLRLDPPTWEGGAGTFHSVRHHLASAHRPCDVASAFVGLVLPPHAVLTVADRTPWTGVPRTLLRRWARLLASVPQWWRRARSAS